MGVQLLAIPFGLSLALWSMAALFVHGVGALITRVSSFKKYTAKQMLIALAVAGTSSAATGVRAGTRLVTGVLRWWLFYAVVFGLFSTLYVTYSEFPETWTGAAKMYNRFAGPYVNQVVLLPLQMADLLLRGLLPLWNSATWFLKALVTQGLLPVLIEEVETVVKMAVSLVSLVTHLTGALFTWFATFLCHGVECLQPERGVLDLFPTMLDARELSLYGTHLGHALCSTLAAPLDILMYPLADINLAEGVHSLVNAVLQLVSVIPHATAVRCLEKEDNQYAILMCTPDLAPFFNFLAAGLTSVGLAVDNWINVAFLIVQTVLGGDPPQCATADNAMIPDLLAADPVFQNGTAAAVVVGLTDWLYAVTDGRTALYLGHSDGTQARVRTWPYAVDTGLGVAAVTYSAVQDLDVSTVSTGKTAGTMQTTAMLGCNCTDDAALGMRVVCAVLPISGVPSEAALEDYRMEILFSDPAAAGLYACAGVDLYVKPVRWSYTRYEAGAGTTHDCISRGTCREVDATVWLIPRCGQDASLNGETACLPVAPCFPFCMAARSAGSAGANLVFVRAARWREGATILGQDCALENGADGPGSVQLGMPAGVAVARAGSTQRGLLQTGGTAVYGFVQPGVTRVCRAALGVTSVVQKNASAQSASGPRTAYNVVLEGQPFAVTGDTLFTTIALGGGVESVQVERLEGDEVDVFSLNPINQQLPSHPKAVVPLDQATLDSTDRLTIPYSYQTNRIAATNSRNYVFYASSPNADVLGPYLEYCANKDDPEKLSRFGILFSSSYSVLRVYRVSAYRRCAAYSCGSDLIRFVTFAGFSRTFGRECDEVFNVSISALEYLNEDNIAVTVLSSRVTGWDAATGGFPGATSKTYWLNPATMRAKDTVWQTDPASSGIPTQIPALCPALQRLPRLGSFVAEVLNAGVFLLRFAVYAVTYTPGLVAVWSAGPRCPAPGSALYHSVLANCGDRVYALDDFFDSLDDAGAVFWHSLSLLARLIAPESKPALAQPITNVLDGMSQYGQGAVDVWAGGAGVLMLTRVPIREQAMQVWATVQAGTAGDGARMVMGLSNPGAGVLAWSRFAYRVFSTVALDLLKRFLDPLKDITLGEAFTLFWADLYDLREEFTTTVTSRMRLACGGIKLMFGVENPWANLLYHQCAAGAELGDGMLRLALDIFVQIPMAKCVCKDVSSRSVASVVTQRCAPPLPVSLVPTLYAIANELLGTQPVRGMACEKVLASVKSSIGGALDAFFAHQYLALDALGSSVEYVTAVFDDRAGRCLDFQNDPHVVVIVPQPVDYFQRCGGTSMCKQACAAEWKAFQAAGSPSVREPEVLTVSMESLFFPGELDAAAMLGNVSASVELPAGTGGCLLRAGAGAQQDFAVAVAEVSVADVVVQFWCAPQMPSSSVYRSDRAAYGPLTVPGALLDLQFGDATGEWLAALAQLDAEEGQAVFLLNGSGVFRTPPVLSALLGDGNTLLRLENLWLVEGFVVVDVLARRLTAYVDPATGQQGARAETVAVHLALLPPLGTNVTVYGRWRTTSVDLLRFGAGDYWYTKLAPDETHPSDYLFIPKTQGLLPYRGNLQRAGHQLAQQGGWEALAPVSLPAMGDASLSARAQRAGAVLATSRTGWDWLKQVRLATDGFVEGVYGSAGVEYSIEIQGSCDERGCEGCASIQVQRLCLAYNKCALVNCVGTPVHQRRPLCGIGALLRQTGRMGLLSTQGAWAIFTEMLALALQLGLMSAKEAYLLWPEDQFLCFMCQAKDSSAEFFSILTATINSALQLGHADIGYMYGGASNVDSNADAVLTISSTAINAFMHQLALFPLYGLAVSHQILMCQVSGVIALAPTDDFRLSIRASKDTEAGDLIAGQCLTVGAEALASFPKDDAPSLAAAVTSHVANALERLAIMQIEPLMHIIDGLLAYLIGVGKALGTLVQSQNMARCAPPDFFLKDVVRCACGDEALQIPLARRTEGLRQGALWCTGVLGMMDSNNQPYYVHNPYTYAELQARSSGLQAYVECVGAGTDGYRCAPPNEPQFANQGVTLANVLVKCRENFVKKRWDPSAYMMFQPASWDLVEFQTEPAIPTGVALFIADCLSTGDPATGSLSQTCLEEFLVDAGVSAETYWQYERLEPARAGPEFNDACLVFSGPAAKGLPEFQACVDGVEGSAGCTLPAHLWSPRSDNDVPLATQHRVLSHGVNRDGLVQGLYAQAHDTVMTAIQAALAVWASGDNPEVNASFFSVEGDVLHQAMDCMFMGPYSRVDYWPIPDCPTGEECLRGPFWSRDEGEGQRRQVDPSTCKTPVNLPFTCGSPARQSLMRYLVQRLLPAGTGVPNQNTSNVGAILRATLRDLQAEWADKGRYGCDCGGGALTPQCCAANRTAPLLPEHLDREFTYVRSNTVLAALEDDMAALYNLALESRGTWGWYMQDVAPNETQAYDWSGSKRATEEAFFDPTMPTSRYDAGAEAMSPLMQEDSTLWDVCHASLKQVFFTLPVDAAGEVRFTADAFDGDPARLEEYVLAFTAEAFQHSPLFRHYVPRHAPSESQMCAEPGDASTPLSAEGTVQHTPFVQNGNTLLGSGSLPQGRSFHPQRFRVGSDGCLCGWETRGDRCYPPTRDNTQTAVCKTLGTCRNDGSYDRALEEGAVLAAFSADWYCPEVELSPHWGYMDPSANEDWLGKNQTTLTTASRDLLRHGRSGLRAGNLQTLPRLIKQYVSPATREIPLERGRLTTCQPPPPTVDLMRPFLDQLFPAAHGSEEAGAAAYCLRYAIELARLEILRLLNQADLDDELALQREVAERWRKRCGTQLHLLHLCVSLGVFRPLTDPANRDAVRCAHFQLGLVPSQTVAYATPQCLVSVDGVFYDPCRCGGITCAGNPLQRLDVLAFTARGAECRLRFDPRGMLKAGPPMGWIDGRHPLPDPEAALLKPGFARDLLNDPDAVGNSVPSGAPWWQAEGPMAENSELCDTVLDWWPEDWDFPVGYHVTVPCDANDTAYRGFTQAFGWDEGSRTLVYQHDLLRDAGLVDSHFGATGLCRAGAFGMPMPETNSMRYCTQIPADDTEDFTLPLRYGEDQTDAPNAWADWKCTESSARLPWPSMAADRGAHQSTRYSIGTIPNMPPETAATYPATSDDMYEVGPWDEIMEAGNGWGVAPETRCQDYTMLRCLDASTCPLGYACRGKVCLLDYSRTCNQDADCGARNDTCRGVCVDPAVQCIKHSDCPNEKMCSGLGTCETPVLVVQNRLRLANDSISLGLGARGDCGAGSREFSLLRASYWGNTGKDLLRTHGLCSFEDWFKYTYTYTKPGCSEPTDAGAFQVDTAACKFVDLEQLDANQSRWWPSGNARPELMYVRPTVCDRDYERLKGFTQCAPRPGFATVRSTGAVWESSDLLYDRFVRLHANESTNAILLAEMPELNDTRIGFLGMGGAIRGLEELDSLPYIACGGVGQCFPYKFTVGGAPAQRLVRAGAGWANYSNQDPFICGAFGVRTASGCALDADRFPLYRLLCASDGRLPSCREGLADAVALNAINRACTSIPVTYQASNQDRSAVLQGLRDLFYVFPLFNTFDEYLRLTTCMADLHGALVAAPASEGLYFPFMFALYEIPFDWFFQCVVMTGFRIQPGLHTAQTCQAHATRAQHPPTDYRSFSATGDSFQTYLQHVRAGYLAEDVARYARDQYNETLTSLDRVVAALVAQMYPGKGADLSYPRCSKNRLWRVGPYGNAYGDDNFVIEVRAAIWNWYDSQTCTQHWQGKLLDRLQALGIPRDGWIDALTDHDPVNMASQDGSGSATIIGEARAAMLASLGLDTVAVSSGGSGAVRFRKQPAIAFDYATRRLPPTLAPTASVNQGTTDTDESVPRTCVFPPVFDPAFAGLPTQGSTTCGTPRVENDRPDDRLRACGNVLCSSIPIYYARNGRFNCRYAADAVIDGTCTESSPGCETQVMDALYGELWRRLREATTSEAPILAPTVLPWFQPARTWAFDGVDLSGILDYERDIQPDPERAVMCEITTDEASATKFTVCNNPHYLRLQAHARKHYKHDGGVLVPAGGQLEWPLDRSVLSRGVILYYANANRTLRKRFMDALFDDETVCKGDPAQHVCRRESQTSVKFRSVNPWTLGNFNPYEVCDVEFTAPGEGSREYIYTYCLEQGNPACKDYLARAPATCREKHRRLVQQVGVPRFQPGTSEYDEYNLCFHSNEEDSDGCMHDQGLLGGYDGLPVGAPAETSYSMIYGTQYEGVENYTVGRNLYESSAWSIPRDFQAGMFAGRNPLWQGAEAPYGHIQVDESEIGGHRIGLVVSRANESVDVISNMTVERLSLNPKAAGAFLDEASAAGRPVGEWVPGLQAAMAAEHEVVRRLYELPFSLGDLAASCPLQRWTFYSGRYTAFSPTLPAAKRAQHLFHRVHGGKLAHPTTRPGPSGQFFGRYRTSNGFCACPMLTDVQQPQCLVPVSGDGPCSLRATINSLLGGAVADSLVFPSVNNEKATRYCNMQLDWPLVDGTLRDGTALDGRWGDASSPTHRECHVLDRFRPFRYKYVAAQTLASTGGKNTVRDGVCSTGRLVTLPTDSLLYARCLRSSLFSTSALIECNTTTETLSLPRKARLTLAEALANRDRRRLRCAQCSRPPGFRSQQGRPIPAESSFGRLQRLSPERMLAKDLRDALCPAAVAAAGSCPALNETAWRSGAFMENYLQHPQRLFLNRTYPNRTAAQPPAAEDPSLWTGKPWVYCPTARALRTGEGCQGTLTRAEWVAGKTRLCPQMVRSYSARVTNGSDGDPMARTPFCPIDRTTDGVCSAIFKARELVRQANCIARGDEACMPHPFVYHPASYEPSNNAWVHDSVKSFYSRANALACPHNTSTDTKLIEFARAYQRTCPANGVNLFVGVLRAVRTVIVDASLLLTTLIGMLFRTLQLFVVSGRDTTRQQIGKNWAYIRSKARATLDTAGDLLVDTLLNSGEAGAKIMRFLSKACASLNDAAEWFLNVWCNYIQKYTLQFLAGIRKLLGITGAGFNILQDFMDEIFQGVLPAAFVAKYATGINFMGLLTEAYSEPTDKKNKGADAKVDSKGNVIKSVPDTANPQQVSRTAGKKGVLARTFGSAGRVLKGIAKASVIAGIGLGLVELVQGIMSSEAEERLRALYPDNFTLFDLSDIVNVVDDMEDFVLSPLSQQTCASFQLMKKAAPTRGMIPCLDLNMDRYTGTAAGTTSIDATMCWANAAPSLGQNSMFSCVGSSTCRRSADSTEFVLCASCPEPVLQGITKFGCNSLLLQCACSQAQTTHTPCAANRECGAQSECELVSAISSVSYGTIPCGNCPNTARLMCLLPPAGMPARCSCMLAGAPSYDLCNDRSGYRTPVDSTRLCGYLHNRQPDLVRWAFDMDDLIILRCAQVSTGVCSDVHRSSLEPLRMVVAETLRASGGSRRLLAEDQVIPDDTHPLTYDAYESEYELENTEALHALLAAPGWNTTAAPCSTLALAYQAGRELGLLETHVLHTCGFWRYVGRRVIARYNLSGVMGGHETFLLSMDDLVYAAMAPDAGLALLLNPGIFVSAFMHHPWMKPVRAVGVLIANQLEYLHWVRSIDADVHDALFGDLSPDAQARQAKEQAIQRIQERIAQRNVPSRPRRALPPSQPAPAAMNQSPITQSPIIQSPIIQSPIIQSPIIQSPIIQSPIIQSPIIQSPIIQSPIIQSPIIQSPIIQSPRRRLLTTEDVLAYSARIIQSPDAAGQLPARVYGAWSTAAFVWPPRYNYSLAACPIALSTLDIGTQVVLINKMYFENFERPPRAIDRSLRASLPGWGWMSSVPPTPRAGGQASWPSTAFHWILDLLAVRPEQLVAFFTSEERWSLTWIIVSLTQCDLASTLTCSRHDKDLLMSTIVFVLMYIAIAAVSSTMGVGFLGTLFLLSYPSFILWYTFGMAPSCAPLLPTCLLSDVITTVEALVPRQIRFPDNLVCDANQTCLRSCTELGFEHGLDPLAFAICDTDDGLCSYLLGLSPTGVQLLDDALLTPLKEGMARFRYVILAGEGISGYRLCTWVSFVTVVPYIAAVGLALLAAGVLVAAVMDMIPPLVGLLCQTYVFYES